MWILQMASIAKRLLYRHCIEWRKQLMSKKSKVQKIGEPQKRDNFRTAVAKIGWRKIAVGLFSGWNWLEGSVHWYLTESSWHNFGDFWISQTIELGYIEYYIQAFFTLLCWFLADILNSKPRWWPGVKFLVKTINILRIILFVLVQILFGDYDV